VTHTCIRFFTRSIGCTQQAAPAPDSPPKINFRFVGTELSLTMMENNGHEIRFNLAGIFDIFTK